MYRKKPHLLPKRQRIRRTATGKAVDCTGRSSDPQSDQSTFCCARGNFSYAAKAEITLS